MQTLELLRIAHSKGESVRNARYDRRHGAEAVMPCLFMVFHATFSPM